MTMEGLSVGRNSPGIFNGTYTVQSPTGDHRTFRVAYWKKADEMTRVVSMLVGPDNEASYKGFGFIDTHGRITVWKAHRGSQFDKLARVLEDLFSPVSRYKAKGMTIHESRECFRCGRTLTTPQSISLGFGPECAKKA